MDAEALEMAVVEKVRDLNIPAEAYPQNPSGYVPSEYPGVVLVRYVGTKYSALDVSGVRKLRQQIVELVAVSTVLRGDDGVYSWLDRIRRQLEGLTLIGAGGPLELEAEEFMDEYNGTWQFGQRWNVYSKEEYEQQDDYAYRSLSAGG